MERVLEVDVLVGSLLLLDLPLTTVTLIHLGLKHSMRVVELSQIAEFSFFGDDGL